MTTDKSSDCTCNPTYLAECSCDEGDCWQCDSGFVEVSENEYLVDRNTERTFKIIHERKCKTKVKKKLYRHD